MAGRWKGEGNRRQNSRPRVSWRVEVRRLHPVSATEDFLFPPIRIVGDREHFAYSAKVKRIVNYPLAAVLLAISLVSAWRSLPASDLTEISDCVFIPTDWGDGDSFRVRTPEGDEHTVRLYGADCFEWHATDESDVRRLRAQRRYFGITYWGGGARESIEIAMGFGEAAYREVARLLDEPFTIHTAHADARGDGRYNRIYAFVVTRDGTDLAEHLVSMGLARAYGVCRETWDGRSQKEYKAYLADRELVAVRKSRGAWAKTDWDNLANERMEQRLEDEEIEMATGGGVLGEGETIDPNRAARDELMKLPGIGEALANRIIEGRPYGSPDELIRVDGIGEATLERMRPFLSGEGK